MVEHGEHKYKGLRGPSTRQGMGRLRRAMGEDEARQGGWERRHDDEDAMEKLGQRGKNSHGGESLLMKFNRVAHDTAHVEGEVGAISGIQGQMILVRRNDGTESLCSIRTALKKRITGVKNPLCVGDRVRIAPPDTEGGHSIIVSLTPRINQLERSDSHNKSLIHVFAANVDCLVIVASLKEPDLKLGLIDRYLVIASASNIPTAIVLNKMDLADAGPTLALYRHIGIPTFAVAARLCDGELNLLREHLLGKTCVIAGQSGVGKSSLANALYPSLQTRIGLVADAGHGRHTTTSARSYMLPDGGSIIDTPGIRECAVTGLGSVDVALHMPDLAAHQPACRYADCTHTHEPDCAVFAAVEKGLIAPSRYENYLSIIHEDLAKH